MKKLTFILVIAAFIMSGCHRSGVPAATLLPSKENQWKPYNFIVKKTVDNYGANKAQFAIQTVIVLSRSRDTSFFEYPW
jgi:peptidoglycan hydrolase CwlO-like protein